MPCSGRLLLNSREMRRHGQHCDADPRQCGAQNVGSGAYRRIAYVGGRNRASIRAHDGYAVADLGPRRRRQILRRLCRLHDRRRASAVRARVQHRRLSTWRHRRGEPVWHSRRRSRARQLVGPLRPQAHVHRRDDYLRGVSRGPLLCVELRPGGDLPVRPGACARVRLPDRAYDHFRKHPESARGKLVLGAFAFQAVGALAGTAVGFLVLSVLPELGAWRWMYASAIIPAVLVTLGRFYIVESANWLSSRGEIDKAEREAKRLLVRKPQYPTEIKLVAPESKRAVEASHSFAALFN